jgi:hypothetical protein
MTDMRQHAAVIVVLATMISLGCGDDDAGAMPKISADSGTPTVKEKDSGVVNTPGATTPGTINGCEQPLRDPGDDACLQCLVTSCCSVGLAHICLMEGDTTCYESWVGCAQQCYAALDSSADAGSDDAYETFVHCMNTECIPDAAGVTPGEYPFPRAGGTRGGGSLLDCAIGYRRLGDDAGADGPPIACTQECFPGWTFDRVQIED